MFLVCSTLYFLYCQHTMVLLLKWSAKKWERWIITFSSYIHLNNGGYATWDGVCEVLGSSDEYIYPKITEFCSFGVATGNLFSSFFVYMLNVTNTGNIGIPENRPSFPGIIVLSCCTIIAGEKYSKHKVIQIVFNKVCKYYTWQKDFSFSSSPWVLYQKIPNIIKELSISCTTSYWWAMSICELCVEQHALNWDIIWSNVPICWVDTLLVNRRWLLLLHHLFTSVFRCHLCLFRIRVFLYTLVTEIECLYLTPIIPQLNAFKSYPCPWMPQLH